MLLLLEGGAEASGASVAVEAEGPRFVSDRVPVGKDKDRRCGKFRRLRTVSSMSGLKSNLASQVTPLGVYGEPCRLGICGSN